MKRASEAEREASAQRNRRKTLRADQKLMSRFTKIFSAFFLTAILSFIVVAVFNNGALDFSAARPAVNKGGETGASISLYSKMAMLSMKEPDALLLMPVEGVRKKQIADTWGADRSEGRGHSGQDIFAKRGTPVYSATEGYVLRVGENRLGGKVVFVLGAGGRRYYYAHLNDFAADLKAGDFVTTDSLIGYVGTTGNAKNTPPHLHFGVYGAGGAMNPLPLLSDRAAEQTKAVEKTDEKTNGKTKEKTKTL